MVSTVHRQYRGLVHTFGVRNAAPELPSVAYRVRYEGRRQCVPWQCAILYAPPYPAAQFSLPWPSMLSQHTPAVPHQPCHTPTAHASEGTSAMHVMISEGTSAMLATVWALQSALRIVWEVGFHLCLECSRTAPIARGARLRTSRDKTCVMVLNTTRGYRWFRLPSMPGMPSPQGKFACAT